MNYLSLFSGIGGFDLAFNRAGMQSVGMCEKDKNCQDVLRKHFPGVTIYDDVKEIGNATHQRGTVDLICGGFPCQDLSIAGKRAGLAGERSGLWFEFARIIDELEPKWVVIENVPGLLSSNKGLDFAEIIRWLVQRGYGVCWRVLDAQYFGVAQRRRRVFIVASFGNGRSAEVLFESEGMFGDTPARRQAGEEVAYSLRSNPSHSGDKGDGGINTTLVSYNIQHNDGGEHKRKDRPNGGMYINETNTALTVGTTDLTAIVMAHGQANAEIVRDGSPSLTCRHEQPIVFADVSSTLRGFGHGWQGQHNDTNAVQIPMVGIRRLTPTECERLQGFPDGLTDGQSDTVRYRQLGNAVAVPVVEWIAKRIVKLRK